MAKTISLSDIYRRRFADTADYRRRVWRALTSEFFARWIHAEHAVLDLGCGYGEFVNQIRVRQKWAMDLNPDTAQYLNKDVVFLQQDCAEPWRVESQSLDVVFTSNFFEHLPGKPSLLSTLSEAFRCLKSGGRLIALGPNIKYLPGEYWDFFDHHTILTELSLAEALELCGFVVERTIARFLPYTIIGALRYPLLFVRVYLRLPWIWPIFGRQFLVIAQRQE
jgi:SAM-dependent methyltransferase